MIKRDNHSKTNNQQHHLTDLSDKIRYQNQGVQNDAYGHNDIEVDDLNESVEQDGYVEPIKIKSNEEKDNHSDESIKNVTRNSLKESKNSFNQPTIIHPPNNILYV